MSPQEMAEQIDALFEKESVDRSDALLGLLTEFRAGLSAGHFRVAEPVDGKWRVNLWVRRGLLLHRLAGVLTERGPSRFDLDTLPEKVVARELEVRIPSGGTNIQDGVFLGPGAVVMPPATVQIGAWIGAEAVIDAHCLIGSGTQVESGARVGAATQIGGVIHPLTALPTIIGKGAIVTGNCGIYDGVVVGENAYLAPGVQLTSRTRLFDLVKKELRTAQQGQPLMVPANAVVVPAARVSPNGQVGGAGFSFHVPVITAYVDDPDFDGDPYRTVL
jgi:2,3,4,5-tetrahydropyridine-2-carboxylate N-succinyltransferase